MDIQKVLEELDCFIQEQKIEKIPSFFEEKYDEAKKAEQRDALLILYNESMGFYREIGNYAKSIECAELAIELAKEMGLSGSVAFATTLLNAANAYRAAGKAERSLELYNQVFAIYEKELARDDMYFANLYNNLSLAYQELQSYEQAKEALLKALAICKENENTVFEIAVTHANLANTCISLEEDEEALEHAMVAVRMFEQQHVEDAHYSAALSALGSLYYKQGLYEKAAETVEKARECVAKYLGRNNLQYERLTDNLEKIRQAYEKEILLKRTDEEKMQAGKVSGLELCRQYYEAYGIKMIAEKFPAYENKIAVGLVGQGSDCFGYDDELSHDHDFGPRFMMWLTKETYDEIGEALQKAYEELPATFLGITRNMTLRGKEREGVFIIDSFYEELLGVSEKLGINKTAFWTAVPEYSLAAATNGEVFRDEEGIFTNIRKQLLSYYTKAVWYRRIAQESALFSQTGEYNMSRMWNRGQYVAAQLAKADCVKHAMKLWYLLQRTYAPHDKWLFKGISDTEVTLALEKLCMLSLKDKKQLTEAMALVEELAVGFAKRLESLGIVGYADAYLDANVAEIMIKSNALSTCADLKKDKEIIEQLSLVIAKAEFEAFDKVQNEGGRAGCQNDWYTFKIMRMSQYLTWDENMLLQYLADFVLSIQKGRNLIEEKYARMMESTAPQKYQEFAHTLPVITEEKRTIMEEIIRIQVEWMESFAKTYPNLAESARSIRTSEDGPYNTSYETYLRGELGTYSDKMLELYGRYIVRHYQNGQNVAYEIITNTMKFYGYESVEDAVGGNNGK